MCRGDHAERHLLPRPCRYCWHYYQDYQGSLLVFAPTRGIVPMGPPPGGPPPRRSRRRGARGRGDAPMAVDRPGRYCRALHRLEKVIDCYPIAAAASPPGDAVRYIRSEEHTSELQTLMRNSYHVFFLK